MFFEPVEEFEIVTTPQGWVATHCSDETIGIAQAHHAARIKPGNPSHIDSAIDSEDARWSGYLGEWVVHAMLNQKHIEHQWLSKEADYDPDFRVNRFLVDVKTKNRSCAPRLEDDWYATVRKDQFVFAPHHDIKAYIFCDYDYKNKWLTVLGKISYAQFASESIFRKKGTFVHEKHTTQEDCHDIALTKLKVPMRWKKAA